MSSLTRDLALTGTLSAQRWGGELTREEGLLGTLSIGSDAPAPAPPSLLTETGGHLLLESGDLLLLE